MRPLGWKIIIIIMKEPKAFINWVELSRFLANNETSVSRNRIPKKYQDKVNSLIQSIERWEKENEVKS